MSTKSSLILTKDGEHWYEEGSQPNHDKNGKFIGYDIVLEFDKSNIVEKDEDNGGIVLTIKGNSDLAKRLSSMMRYTRATEI